MKYETICFNIILPIYFNILGSAMSPSRTLEGRDMIELTEMSRVTNCRGAQKRCHSSFRAISATAIVSYLLLFLLLQQRHGLVLHTVLITKPVEHTWTVSKGRGPNQVLRSKWRSPSTRAGEPCAQYSSQPETPKYDTKCLHHLSIDYWSFWQFSWWPRRSIAHFQEPSGPCSCCTLTVRIW